MAGKFKGVRRACTSCTFWREEFQHCEMGVPRDTIALPDLFVCSRHEIRPPAAEPSRKDPNFYLRSWFDTTVMVSEAARIARRVGLRSDDVVLDLGAHIGAFGCCALREFDVKHCVFAEAEPINLPVLQRNAAVYGDRATVVPRAITGEHPPPTVPLYRTGFTGCSGIIGRKRLFFTVQRTLSFQTLLATYRPTVLKSDVEGAEHFYDWHVNDELRLIHLEVHPHPEGGGTREGPILRALEDQGFAMIDFQKRMAYVAAVMRRGTDE